MEVEFESCVECNYFNDRARKVRKTFPKGCKIKSGKVFWRTELSYAQNKQRGEKERLLGIDTCPSLNDIMGIRCIKCSRSEQVYDFKSFGVSCLVDN